MTKKSFFEIRNYLRREFSGCSESEIGMKIIVNGGIAYKVAFTDVDPQESFVVLPMGDTIAFVPYENIIAVEY